MILHVTGELSGSLKSCLSFLFRMISRFWTVHYIFVFSLIREIMAEPSHWHEDIDVYSICDLVDVG